MLPPLPPRPPVPTSLARLFDDIRLFQFNSPRLSLDPLSAAALPLPPPLSLQTLADPKLTSAIPSSYFLLLDPQSNSLIHLIVESFNSPPSSILLSASFATNTSQVYEYSSNNSLLRITFRKPLLGNTVWDLFSQSAIKSRYLQHKHIKPDAPCPAPATALKTLFRAIATPLSDPLQLSPIPNENFSVNVRITPSLLINTFGFIHLPAENVLVPPPIDPQRALDYLCALHEIAVHATALHDHQPATRLVDASQKLRSIFNLQTSQYPLFPPIEPAFIALGASQSMSDTAIAARYDLLARSLPTSPVTIADALAPAHYFEALDTIARARASDLLLLRSAQLVSLGATPASPLRDALRALSIPESESCAAVRAALRQTSPEARRIADFLGAAPDLPAAYAALGVAASANDELVHLAYETRAQDGATPTLRAALTAVAVARASPVLLRVVEDAWPEEMAIDEAYALLKSENVLAARSDTINDVNDININDINDINDTNINNINDINDINDINNINNINNININNINNININNINDTVPDDTLLTTFSHLSQERPQDILLLRRALRTIALSRHSTRLANLLDGSNTQRPLGLENIGNTCYLNSLLQYYFSVKPLRDAVVQKGDEVGEVFEHSPHPELKDLPTTNDPPTINNLSPKRIGGRLVTVPELLRSRHFVRRLAALFTELASSNAPYVRPSDKLAFMALVQAAQDPDEWRYVEMAKEYMGDHPNDHPNDNPTDTDKIGMAEALNVSGQQDVTECIENVLFQIECALEGHGRDADGEQEDLVKDLFYGKTSQSLHDPETGSLFGASKTERFLMLIVSLAGYGNGLSVYDVLDNYFEDAVVDLGSRKAIRRVAATQFPPVLQLQLQRVQFDARARRVYKSIAQVRLADRIFVDQYLDTPAALAHKQEAAAWRARLAAARSELAAATQRSAAGTALLDTLLTAHSILSRSQRVSPATLSFLARHTTELRIRLDTLKQTAAALEQQLATQRGLAQTQPYRLHAVFVHRGQASFGHYWVYIRDFEKDLFRKYNDKSVAVAEVTEVTGEVIEDPQATAYFVTYVKEDMVDKVVQVQ